MVKPRVDFLYLDEKDMIEAGVLNMHECVKEMENVFRVMSSGDYIHGGRNQNSHGMMITFPDNPIHEGMPKNGPDRRFCAMPGYLGGNYRVCGCKWYGSNVENVPRELPRSILMMTLNDADTGAPLAHMSANLLSAWRTGAIPGVGAKHLANPNAEVYGVVGTGAIGTSSSEAILDVCKNLKLVKLYDIIKPTAEILKERLNKEYPNLEIKIVDTIEETIRDSDIINLATSGEASPRVEEEWIKPGTLVIMSATALFDPDFVIKRMKIVVDNWKMYEAGMDEGNYPYYKPSGGSMGKQLLDWVQEGKMSADIITNIGDVITDKAKGRESKDDIVFYGLGGQPAYDIAWGYRIYQNALEKGIGTKLNLWERAYQAR